jgi:hypothetical protein
VTPRDHYERDKDLGESLDRMRAALQAEMNSQLESRIRAIVQEEIARFTMSEESMREWVRAEVGAGSPAGVPLREFREVDDERTDDRPAAKHDRKKNGRKHGSLEGVPIVPARGPASGSRPERVGRVVKRFVTSAANFLYGQSALHPVRSPALVVGAALVGFAGWKLYAGGNDQLPPLPAGKSFPSVQSMAAGPVVPDPAPGDGDDRLIDFDSRIAVPGAEWNTLRRLLEKSTSEPVRQLGSRWAAGGLDTVPARLESALVQVALNHLRGLQLTVDGQITRSPCGGNTCREVRAYWIEHSGKNGFPDFSEEPTGEVMRRVERLIILDALEKEGPR